MNKLLSLLLLFLFSSTLISCNKGNLTGEELRAKSQARGDIIKRSGTIIFDEKEALKDAKNRLRSGGGLLGKKPASIGELFNGGTNQVGYSAGMSINAILWKSSLETISFMPISSADPFGGIIITEWYNGNNSKERCKLNVFVKGVELKTSNIKVNSFCQLKNSSGDWVDQKINETNNLKLENAILNNAKKIKLGLN